MEPNALGTRPEPHNDVTSGLPPSPTEPTKQPGNKKRLIISIVTGLVALGLVSLLVARQTIKSNLSKAVQEGTPSSLRQNSTPKEVEQLFVNPADNSKTPLNQADYYEVAIDSTQTYYGNVNKINDEYLRLTHFFYKNGGALTFGGNELHGPEQATYVRAAKVTKLQKLAATSQESVGMAEYLKAHNTTPSDAYPKPDINSYLKADQLQAFFFADGTAFFAKASGLSGNFLAGNNHVYVLRAADGINPNGSTSTQTSLVLATPEQYKDRAAADLLYWQNLKQDSQVSKAISLFEKQQPH
ncbi:MAG TPA: hypothetical protein VM124_00710 [Candidatus Limnocylindrales bacterium]|nr:hypothetical protein [Candidatus Limnocylindrales bacterium]